MADNTGIPQAGVGSTINHYYQPPPKGWKEGAILITLTLNIAALLAVVFGGMNWVTETNTSIKGIAVNQENMTAAIKELQEFDRAVIELHAREKAINEMKEKGLLKTK